jgi:hypothetical protein
MRANSPWPPAIQSAHAIGQQAGANSTQGVAGSCHPHFCIRRKYGHKLLFPTFDGTEDSLLWLNRCDHFFKVQETHEAGKVFLASSFYMTSAASQWYTLHECNHGQPLWEEFVKLVNQLFGPPLRSNPLGKLIQLCQEGSVAEY